MANSRSQMDRLRDAMWGFLLGLGAPLGWLLLRFFLQNRSLISSWLYYEISAYKLMYVYLAFTTTLAFVLFGYFLGRHSDELVAETSDVRESLNKINDLAMTDALTGIRNARYLHDHLSLEIESAQRYGTPLCCVMLDIDDFKQVNDRWGHAAGDVVLAAVAKTISKCVRRIDIVGRLGGEEFLVIMPHAGPATTLSVAERVRQTVERWPIVFEGNEIHVTVSVGVSTYPAKGVSDKSGILKTADDALYQAKRSGKNCTKVAASAADVAATATPTTTNI